MKGRGDTVGVLRTFPASHKFFKNFFYIFFSSIFDSNLGKMNKEENKFPELSGIELHYDSDELSVKNPNKIFDEASDSTGSGKDDVPGVSESLGASLFSKHKHTTLANGFVPTLNVQEEVPAIQPALINSLLDRAQAEAYTNFAKSFEEQLLFGKSSLGPAYVGGIDLTNQVQGQVFTQGNAGASNWFNEVMEGNDLKLLKQLMTMPKCMIAEAILGPKKEYNVVVQDQETGAKSISNVLGENLTVELRDILIDEFIDEVEKVVGDKPVVDRTAQEEANVKHALSEYTLKKAKELLNIPPPYEAIVNPIYEKIK